MTGVLVALAIAAVVSPAPATAALLPQPLSVVVKATVSGSDSARRAAVDVAVATYAGAPAARVPVTLRLKGQSAETSRALLTDGAGRAYMTVPAEVLGSGSVEVLAEAGTGLRGFGRTRFAADVRLLGTEYAAWNWHTQPVAMRSTRNSDRTFVGSVSRSGEVAVVSIDHITGEQTRTVLYRYAPDEFTGDDHNNPAVYVRSSDGRVVVFWSGHASPTVRWRVSARPGDTSSFGPVRQLAPVPGDTNVRYTYTQIVELSEEGRIYLFTRRDYRRDGVAWRAWEVNISTDDGETFLRNPDPLWQLSGRVPYTHVTGDGRSTMWFVREDTGASTEKRTGLYVLRYRDGSFTAPDGSAIATWGALPLSDPSVLPKIDRPQAADEVGVYAKEIYVAKDDSLWIAYSTLGPDGRNTYWSARWAQGAWVTARIADGGRSVHPGATHPHYDAGLTFDSADPTRAYLGREVGSGSQRRYVIERWRTDDEGRSWRFADRVSTPAAAANLRDMRPIVPIGHHPDLAVIWMRGRYRTYTDWTTQLMAASDSASAPVARIEESASPVTGTLDPSAGRDSLTGVSLAEGDRITATLSLQGQTSGPAAKAMLGVLPPGAREPADDPLCASATASAENTATVSFVVPRGAAGRYAVAASAVNAAVDFRLSWSVEPAGSRDRLVPVGGSAGAGSVAAGASDRWWVWLDPGDELSATVEPESGAGGSVTVSVAGPPPSEAALAKGGSIRFRAPAGQPGPYALRVTGSSSAAVSYRVRADVRAGVAISTNVPKTLTAYGEAVPLYYRLTTSEGDPVPGVGLAIEESYDGGEWSLVKRLLTSSAGSVRLTVTADRKRSYRARYDGDTTRSSAGSSSVTIVPRVALSAARTPYSVRAGARFSAWGYLRPRHASGSHTVRVLAQRWNGKEWSTQRVFAATNTGTAPVTVYRTSFVLPAGIWRFQAWAPADARHAGTYAKPGPVVRVTAPRSSLTVRAGVR